MTNGVSAARGDALVAKGAARRFVDFDGEVAFQLLEAKPRTIRPSDPSRAALGPAEIKANAGLMGSSRTKHLSEEARSVRSHAECDRLLPEEDFVERVGNLVRSYPASANFHDIRQAERGKLRRPLAPGGDRAVRVYPKAAQ